MYGILRLFRDEIMGDEPTHGVDAAPTGSMRVVENGKQESTDNSLIMLFR